MDFCRLPGTGQERKPKMRHHRFHRTLPGFQWKRVRTPFSGSLKRARSNLAHKCGRTSWFKSHGGPWKTAEPTLSAKRYFSRTGNFSKLFSLPPKPHRTPVCSILSLNSDLVACWFFCSFFSIGHLQHHQTAGQLEYKGILRLKSRGITMGLMLEQYKGE